MKMLFSDTGEHAVVLSKATFWKSFGTKVETEEDIKNKLCTGCFMSDLAVISEKIVFNAQVQ